MPETIGDELADQINTTQRVAELEIEVARLSAELDAARGGDPAAGAARILTLAASTVDQAVAEVSKEAEAVVAKAEADLDEKRAEAEQATAAARAEADAARSAAEAVAHDARLEVEEARSSAMAIAEDAAAAAEETDRTARAAAEQIVAAARDEASTALESERQRFTEEVDALTGVREALINERQVLGQYRSELQSRVRDLAEAMVSFMTDDSQDDAMLALVEFTTPEIVASRASETTTPVEADEVHPPETETGSNEIAEPDPPSLIDATDPTVDDSEASSAAVDEDEASTAAVDGDEASSAAVDGDEASSAAVDENEASTAAVDENEASTAASDEEEVGPESVDDRVTDEGYPIDTYGASFAASSGGSDDQPADKRPEDLFSDSFGFGSSEAAAGEFGPRVGDASSPTPGSVRPVVESIPPSVPIEPVSTPTAPSAPSGPGSADDPWRDVGTDGVATNRVPLFPKPDDAPVMAAVRADGDLFGPAREGEGPSDEDEQFRDFIEGDDDDASRSWFLKSDEG